MKKIKYPCDETGQEYARFNVYSTHILLTTFVNFRGRCLRLVIQTKSLINKFHVLIHNFYYYLRII